MTTGFVYIVESPSAADLLDGRTEGRVLSEALRLADTPHTYSVAANVAQFEVALGQRLVNAWQQHKQWPILHLSMHGNSDGVAFTSGEFLTWAQLREKLLPLIRVMPNALLICMSSCFGFSGCRIAMHHDGEPHFWALVGHPGDVNWTDAAVAYVTFYHRFFKGASVPDSVDAMRFASGDTRFLFAAGDETKRDWLVQLAKLQTPSLSDLLRSVAGVSAPVASSFAPHPSEPHG